MFSYKFWEISKNTFSYRTPLVAASGDTTNLLMKANWVIKTIIRYNKPSITVLELLRKEDMDNMEIQDGDVSFVNSIVPILQSLPAKKKIELGK